MRSTNLLICFGNNTLSIFLKILSKNCRVMAVTDRWQTAKDSNIFAPKAILNTPFSSLYGQPKTQKPHKVSSVFITPLFYWFDVLTMSQVLHLSAFWIASPGPETLSGRGKVRSVTIGHRIFFNNCKLFTIDVALGISKVSPDSDFFSFCTRQPIFKSDEKWSDN